MTPSLSPSSQGLRLIRHGSLHGSVLGLEVVLADGTVLDLLRTLRKDNTGYDLKQLFIGAEGTLGVVTKVALIAPRRPARVDVAFVAVPSFAAACAALRRAKRDLAELLSAFEFLDRASLELVNATLPGTEDPLPGTPAPFYVVIEMASSSPEGTHERARLGAYLDALRDEGTSVGGVVGRDVKHTMALWNLRERISVALKHAGAVYKYDVSIPTEQMYALVEDMRTRIKERVAVGGTGFDFSGVTVVGYGHLGDGNLHLNISSPAGYHKELEAVIEPFVYEWTAARRGSVSAEHGIGMMKPNEVAHSKPSEAIALMQGVKKLMDPQGILNPYKVLPWSNGRAKL